MTLADLAAVIRERALALAREQVTVAWRTAYYHRIKQMPDLAGELEGLAPAWQGAAADIDDRGYMSEARMHQLWAQIKSGVMAWNARFAADGA